MISAFADAAQALQHATPTVFHLSVIAASQPLPWLLMALFHSG